MAKHMSGHWQNGTFVPDASGNAEQMSGPQQLIMPPEGLDAFSGLSPLVGETTSSALPEVSSAIPPLDLTSLGEFLFTGSTAGHSIVKGPAVMGGNVAFVTVTQSGGGLIVSSGSEDGVSDGPNGGATLLGYNSIIDSPEFAFNFQPDP